MYELAAVKQKKRQYAQNYDARGLKALLTITYQKGFSILRWVLPVVAVVEKLLKHLFSGKPFESYEYASLAVICVMLFACCSFGKWLIGFVEKRACAGTVYQRNDEQIILFSPNEMEYRFTEQGKKICLRLIIDTVVISERMEQVEIHGTSVQTAEPLRLVICDYFEPSLIKTIKELRR